MLLTPPDGGVSTRGGQAHCISSPASRVRFFNLLLRNFRRFIYQNHIIEQINIYFIQTNKLIAQ
ncbi:hypothetical protein A3D78_05770 [Candidatus Gottesmanbacteria bacterium RIFCSPHIGHO2_02_FULL_39_14]|uniref:Uncharacterized protein n=1 Tax=Candidatus Gottesmanbacteria bacterium RIFCSPHIGHO2_02_FULL_39_14 TaxID=1798383 RepID=A0A1F6A2N1_9BACT|nr:MAG: hypothetical protein A3D78_05770 [Candidatus Gottesmanbacteria bacterium RIFCSPHIGHO2_02_FULL_39_14]